jgi:hypothetical protein
MDPALESEIRAAHGAILDRFEQGLSEIEEGARALMRSAAEDTWQGTEAELKELRERIMRDLSRDQALRGLIAHADERYQAIDVRVARIEGNLVSVERAATALTSMLGEASTADIEGATGGRALHAVEERMAGIEMSLEAARLASRQLQERFDAGLAQVSALDVGLAQVSALVAEIARRPQVVAADSGDLHMLQVDLQPVTERLAAVQDYMGEVVEYLSARDQALVDWIQGIAKHTDGVVEAEGARVEEAVSNRLDLSVLEADGRLREAVTQHLEEIHERLQEHALTLGEAVSVAEIRTLARLNDQEVLLAAQSGQLEAVTSRLEAIRQAAVDAAERISVGLHDRLADLGDQMRAETDEMRVKLVDRARESGVDAMQAVDERLGRLAELVQAALGWSVDEIDQRIHKEILRAVSVGMADFIATMDRRFVDLRGSIDERLASVSRNMGGHIDLVGRKMDERLERTDLAMRAGLGALEESITERSTQAVESLLDTKLAPATEQVTRAVESARIMLEETVVRNVAQRADAVARLVDERGLAATRLIEERTADIAGRIEERAATGSQLIEDRMAATARMIEERAEITARLIEERAEVSTRIFEQRADAITRLIEDRTAAAARTLEEAISRTVSERVAALASLIRSDNTAIADRLAVIEEQAAAKEAIRAIKELAAAMPQDISIAMDERLAVLGELFRRENKHTVDTVARAATALADRLDKTAIVIGERFDRDVEVVVDQIGTTMQTLASGLQRSTGRGVVNRQ